MHLWFPTTAYAASASGHAEMQVDGHGTLLSSLETAPGVYNVPDSLSDAVLQAIPSLQAKPLYSDAVLGLAPLAYWPLGEPSGNAVDQISGKALVPSGTPLRAQPSILPNGEGASVTFSGANSEFFRQATDDSAFDFTNLSPFSISAWGYSTTADGIATYGISKRSTAGSIGGNIFMYRPNPQLALYRYDSVGIANSLASTLGTAPRLAVVHYVGTYDGSTLRVFINGVSGATPLADLRVQNDSTVNLTVGGPAHTTGPTWAGGMQEVVFWNRALSADEIESLWRAGH